MPENKSGADFDQTADREPESSTLERITDLAVIDQSRPCRAIVVKDIPGDILVDPVAFGEFLLTNIFQPCCESSGRYSEKSIQILHYEFSQLTEKETIDIAPLMKVPAEMALF